MAGYARFIDDYEVEYQELRNKDLGKRFGYYDRYIVEKAVCDCTFMNCATLRDISLPEGFNHVGCHAFDGCERLIRCTMPLGIRCVDEHAFANCFNLQFLELPEGIDEVSYGVCEHCPSLSMVKLPSTIKRIKTGAFSYCGNLKLIIFNGTTAHWESIPKDRDWDLHCGEYDVRCLNGTVEVRFAQ